MVTNFRASLLVSRAPKARVGHGPSPFFVQDRPRQDLPIAKKGSLPQEIAEEFEERSKTFEKTFFDLTREPSIRDHIADLKRKQVIVAGCETDVCVLQSCLGLLSLGYQVYMVENLLFSASDNVDSALARMKAAGATFVTYKTLFYELAASVDTEERLESAGPVTKNLPN